jgi:hypothetical protein
VNPSVLSVPDTALEREAALFEQLIARVLGRAHRTAEVLDAPDEARAILHVAQSFADELGAVDPEFERVQFIKEVMEEPS